MEGEYLEGEDAKTEYEGRREGKTGGKRQRAAYLC
jgi:hypothetical protein